MAWHKLWSDLGRGELLYCTQDRWCAPSLHRRGATLPLGGPGQEAENVPEEAEEERIGEEGVGTTGPLLNSKRDGIAKDVVSWVEAEGATAWGKAQLPERRPRHLQGGKTVPRQ